jgi:DNA-binding NtrC family response regulator
MAYAVLVVDDEPWLTEFYADALSSMGFEITMANTAAEAVGALEGREFDAMISDIRLRETDGLRLYQTVLERFPRMETRFGFYTAYDDEVAREFVARRAIPLLRKPCRLTELAEFVWRLIDQ